MFQNNPYIMNNNSNPYNNFYGQQPNYYQNNIQQTQMSVPNNQYFQQSLNEVIAGSIVDSEDVVKSKNCSLDGSATYYPLSDKSAIYVKQLNPQTGAGMMFKYKLEAENDIQEVAIDQKVETLFSSLREELLNEINEIKNIVVNNNSKIPKDNSEKIKTASTGGKW